MEMLSGESGLGELIELGCGAGFTKVLAENASHAMATDLSDEMLAVARKQLKDRQNVTVESAGFKVEEVQLMEGKTKALYLRGRKR